MLKKLLLILTAFVIGCSSPTSKPLGLMFSPSSTPVAFDLKALGVKNGDSVTMASGTWAGINASGFSKVHIKIGGSVILTKQLHLGNTDHIWLDGRLPGQSGLGIKYTGNDFSVVDLGPGNNDSDRISNMDFGNTASTILDASTKIWTHQKINGVQHDTVLCWNGKPASAAFFDFLIDSFAHGGKTELLLGTYEPPYTGNMFSIAPYFCYGVCQNDGTGSNVKINGNSIYAAVLDHYQVLGPSINSLDCGIAYIGGNITISNCYRYMNWGYWLRLIDFQLMGLPYPQISGMYNNRDVSSTHYGTVDYRQDNTLVKSTTNPVLKWAFSDFYFQNNTSINKVDGPDQNNTSADGGAGHYVVNAIVLGNTVDGYGVTRTVHAKYNFAGNADNRSGMAGGSSFLKNNASIAKLDTASNIDLPPGVAIPNGWVDQVTGFPLVGSILLTKGIGAQPPASTPIPPVNPCPPTIHDTLIVKVPYPVHDTLIVNVPYPVHDTLTIKLQPKGFIYNGTTVIYSY